MSEPSGGGKALKDLQDFFERPVCQKGTGPLKNGIRIAIHVGDAGPFTLEKINSRAFVRDSVPANPDMTFWVPPKALEELLGLNTEDVGDVGVAIIRLMAHSDPERKVTAKVHIGLFGIITGGYLGVLPLGGVTVMKYLASKGFTGIGKIKDAIQRLRV